MASLPRLRVVDVSVRWGDLLAVDAATLDVAAGEVVALLGPSGCGKSSLLAAVAGLVPHAGTVAMDGTDVTARRTDERGLGLMFQDGALFPHLDVGDNVGFGPRMQGWDRTRRQDRVRRVLALVGLDGLARRPVDRLSGGQAQRVALARAIAPRPRLLLLDEPLSSLDARLRSRLLEELPDVFAAIDAAVVHVTHDQDEAMALADRVAVMRDGRIVRMDTPRALWQDPGSAFVAQFLGWRNVVAVSAGTGGDHPVLDVPDRVQVALGRPDLVGVDGTRLVVGLDRGPGAGPRDADGSDRQASWTGTVRHQHFSGDHVSVDIALSDTTTVLRATGPVHTMPGPGDDVVVSVPDDAWRPLTT